MGRVQTTGPQAQTHVLKVDQNVSKQIYFQNLIYYQQILAFCLACVLVRYRSYIPAFCLSHILESRILSAPCSCTLSVVNSGILSDVCSGAFSQSLHCLRPRRVSSHQCVHSCPGRSFWKTTACNQTPLQQNLLNVQLESALQKVHFMGPGKVASWRTPEKAELSPSNNCES